MSEPICVIVTGLSGAGKSVAIDCFEDFGFFCVDNLPVALVPKLMELCVQPEEKYKRLALGIDIRVGDELTALYDYLGFIHRSGYKLNMMYLEAADEAIIRRFSFTRRKHPIGGNLPLTEQIQMEKDKLENLRKVSDWVVDTSTITPQALRNLISQRYVDNVTKESMAISLFSFGYKNGLPLDADFVFDVRFLSNPFWEPEMRLLPGTHPTVQQYLLNKEATQTFLDELARFVDYVVASMIQEGKSYMTIAIGCTGGKHRSVFVAEWLKEHLTKAQQDVRLSHRDIGK